VGIVTAVEVLRHVRLEDAFATVRVVSLPVFDEEESVNSELD